LLCRCWGWTQSRCVGGLPRLVSSRRVLCGPRAHQPTVPAIAYSRRWMGWKLADLRRPKPIVLASYRHPNEFPAEGR
ncbi:hypothetical protein T12_2328, partial [Trichinella patagoniensis]